MLLGLVAKDRFAGFNEDMKKHFQKEECQDWILTTSYKGNAIRIWQKIAEYNDVPIIKKM